MKRRKAARKLPASQRNNVKALAKTQGDIGKLVYGLHRAYNRRHRLVNRIFDEVEKNPSLYTHVTPKGKGRAKLRTPMTAKLARQLRAQYRRAFQPLAITGPGCDSPPVCLPMQDCVCIFSVGTICCYACLSPEFIQCN